MFERVEFLIAGYMKRYENNYEDAIDMMIVDLEAAKTEKQLKADAEDGAKDLQTA